MRTFAAIEIPLNIEQYGQVEAIKQSMANESMRWAECSGLHLTLFFFGETSPVFIAEFDEFLQTLTSKMKPFDLFVKGLGFFGLKDNPKILYLDIEPNAMLNLLQDKISFFAEKNGFNVNIHDYTPHITLARIKSVRSIDDFLQTIKSYGDKVSWQFKVDRVALYKSESSSMGPKYSPVFWHSLKG